MVFLGKANQVFDLDRLALISNERSVIPAKHLVHLAGNDAQVGLGQPVFKRGKHQVETVLLVGKFPGMHVIAGNVIEFDLLQFMDAVVQDDRIFAGAGKVAEAAAQVETDRAPIGQEP